MFWSIPGFNWNSLTMAKMKVRFCYVVHSNQILSQNKSKNIIYCVYDPVGCYQISFNNLCFFPFAIDYPINTQFEYLEIQENYITIQSGFLNVYDFQNQVQENSVISFTWVCSCSPLSVVCSAHLIPLLNNVGLLAITCRLSAFLRFSLLFWSSKLVKSRLLKFWKASSVGANIVKGPSKE